MPKSKTQFSDVLRNQRKTPKKNRRKPPKQATFRSTPSSVPVPQKVMKVRSPVEKRPSRGASLRIAHREFIGTVTVPAVTNQTWQVMNISLQSGALVIPARFRMNPASEGTFAWLSPIARCFERFRWRKLKIILLPKTNFNQTGDNLITPDYDAEDGAPFSELQATNNVDTVSGPLMQTIVCNLLPSRLNRAYESHYCMSDARFATTTQDTKTIDPAQVIISGENGVSAGASFAKLWVEYDVDFDTPQAPTESMNQGGAVQAQTTSGSGFGAVSFASNQQQPIATSLNNNTNTNLLQFNRPWSGDLTSVFSSTGALNPASYVPLKNGNPFPAANSGAGSFNYAPVTSTAVGAGGGSSFRVDPVSFNVGDILSYTATLPSVASGLNVYLGGSSAGLLPAIL